ncbi:hypothetical protein T4D_11206 [Trichinella pseudospiralis]|uniref:Uncharacterized protein n=1 Tax=Trichinella pseudospiralis TaxID=6337 RepID=A0A0V1DL20_TRIPS|nr:hypothetical protein T4D_11206 [Trichinella pseudospiralis]
MLADRSLIQLSSERLCQILTNKDELRGPYMESMGGEALGPVKA